MASTLMKKIMIAFSSVFSPTAGTASGKVAPQKRTSADDTDMTCSIALDELKVKHPMEEEISDDGKWWKYAPVKMMKFQRFEREKCRRIISGIHRSIEEKTFSVIELPSNVTKAISILSNPEFDYYEIGSLINKSPGMAGEFLKVINSSIYSRGVPVNDLRQALPRLGRVNIKAMLYMYSAKISFEGSPDYMEIARTIVDHSYATGIISAFLSQRYYPDSDSAFLSGLLHDVGKLGIIRYLSDSGAFTASELAGTTEESFAEIFNELHADAGKYLADSWKIDPMVSLAIEHHHDFYDACWDESEQNALSLSCLVNLSDKIARILGFGRTVTEGGNIFDEPATIELNIERNQTSMEFFEDIPATLTFRTQMERSNENKDDNPNR